MHYSGQSGGECNATCMSITNLITSLCSGMRLVNELKHVQIVAYRLLKVWSMASVKADHTTEICMVKPRLNGAVASAKLNENLSFVSRPRWKRLRNAHTPPETSTTAPVE